LLYRRIRRMLGLLSYRLQFEFVSGILIFIPDKGAPRPQCLCALRPRLAEVAVVQAPLVTDLLKQLLELLDCKIYICQRVWIGWPVGYLLRHLIKNIPNFLAQFHGKLLRGTRLTLVRVNFVERPVVARLSNYEPQCRLAQRVTCTRLFKIIDRIVQDDIKPLRDQGDVDRRIQTV